MTKGLGGVRSSELLTEGLRDVGITKGLIGEGITVGLSDEGITVGLSDEGITEGLSDVRITEELTGLTELVGVGISEGLDGTQILKTWTVHKPSRAETCERKERKGSNAAGLSWACARNETKAYARKN